jgi:hypothetical protein
MRLALLLLIVCSCRTPEVARQGGVDFREVVPPKAVASGEAVFGVCWPTDALSSSRVQLIFESGDVGFRAGDGASNSTGRCLRELAAVYPWAVRPTTPLELRPPTQPLDGWAALAWVRLLSPTRFDESRGLLDPEPLVRACFEKLGALRAGTIISLNHDFGVRVRIGDGAATAAERCVESVLGATVWPSPRPLVLAFPEKRGEVWSAGDVSAYVMPGGDVQTALDPATTKEIFSHAAPRVKACWESALLRRAGLSGARTVRFRTSATTGMSDVWIIGNPMGQKQASDYLLDQCLRDVVRTLDLRPSAGEGLYTWVFAGT